MDSQYLRRRWEHRGLFCLDMLVDVVPQRVESGLKRRIVIDLLQGCHESPELLMILQRITDQPLPLLVGLLSKGRVNTVSSSKVWSVSSAKTCSAMICFRYGSGVSSYCWKSARIWR